MREIMKAELINRHPDDILASGSDSKKFINWPRILLAIIMTFELLQHSIECLFLFIKKVIAMIHILSL